MTDQLILRDYQSAILAEVQQVFRRRIKRVVMRMPTGAGKTATASKLAQLALGKGTRVLFVAHRKELVEQMSEALGAWGVNHGLICTWGREESHPVQVAMVGTLARRMRLDKQGRYGFDLIVIDECHHATPGNQWGMILDHNPDAWVIGLTATPNRLDGRPLGRSRGGYFDDLVEGPSELDLIEQGYLSPLVVFRPSKDKCPDFSNLRKRGWDYDNRELDAITNVTKVTGNVIEHYRKHTNYAPGVAFCVTINHAGKVADMFKVAGYQSAVLTGKTSSKERAQMMRDIRSGELHMLTSCNTISEGTDIPGLVCGILLRKTASIVLCRQMCGRIFRTAPGKQVGYILDHVGNTLPDAHGLPTDDIQWSLDGKPKKKSEAPVRQCPQCYAIVPISTLTCPECGFVWDEDEQQGEGGGREVEVEEGELEAIDAVAEARRKRALIHGAKTLDELREVGQQLGYKPGWAWVEFKRREKKAKQLASAYPEASMQRSIW